MSFSAASKSAGRVLRLVGQDRHGVGDPEPLGDGDGVLDDVLGVAQDLVGVVGAHLLLQLVEAHLDARCAPLRGAEEGVHRGDHALVVLEVAADRGGGVALLDLEQHLAVARAGVVGGVRQVVLEVVEALGDHEVGAADDHGQRHDHRQAAGEPATLLLLARAAEVRRSRRRRLGRAPPVRRSARSTSWSSRVAVAHDSPVTVCPRTISPGGRPVARSVSRACCRMSTAAAWSTTARRSAPFFPRSRSIASALTVVRRSSWRRTSTGAIRAASRGGELPGLHRGRPLAARERARQADHDLDGLLVAHQPREPRRGRPCPGVPSPAGVARNPVGSLRATPIRASPGSIPRRTPWRIGPASPGRLGDRGPRRRQRLVDPRRVGAAALGDVVLAAAAAADQGHHRGEHVVRPDPALAGLVVGRGDDGDLAVLDADQHRGTRAAPG